MAEPLQVNPAHLHASARHMESLRADHQRAHTAANGLIESALSGMVGSSAAALASEFVEWQAHSLHITNETTHFGGVFDRIGSTFSRLDDDHAAAMVRLRTAHPDGLGH